MYLHPASHPQPPQPFPPQTLEPSPPPPHPRPLPLLLYTFPTLLPVNACLSFTPANIFSIHASGAEDFNVCTSPPPFLLLLLPPPPPPPQASSPPSYLLISASYSSPSFSTCRNIRTWYVSLRRRRRKKVSGMKGTISSETVRGLCRACARLFF